MRWARREKLGRKQLELNTKINVNCEPTVTQTQSHSYGDLCRKCENVSRFTNNALRPETAQIFTMRSLLVLVRLNSEKHPEHRVQWELWIKELWEYNDRCMESNDNAGDSTDRYYHSVSHDSQTDGSHEHLSWWEQLKILKTYIFDLWRNLIEGTK